MPQAFICDAIRTPFGRYGGALASIRTDDLGAWPMQALMARQAVYCVPNRGAMPSCLRKKNHHEFRIPGPE